MSSTTTLITFRVRCPPSTRRVELLGSWDNFSQPYPMQRDTRIGKEHWRGCHSFKNIICDGDPARAGSAREGGLKMGGTYWYYYLLDDDIEFHNSAEPSTTSCPLLPGQLVNVLHVPYHFSSGVGRDRNGSVSSTSSELRTMDPEMKFLNPRPAPPPRLPRLQTSPPLLQKSDAFDSSPSSFPPLSMSSESTGRSFSQPSSATSQRRPRLPKRPWEDTSRSTSPTKQSGFLATLKQLAARASDAERMEDRTPRAKIPAPASSTSSTLSRTSSGRISKHPASSSRGISREHSPTAPRTIVPPAYEPSEFSDIEDGPSLYLSQMQRRNRSRSRDPSPLRNSLILTTEQEPDLALPGGVAFRPAALDTLQEAPSQQNSPVHPLITLQGNEQGDGIVPPIDQNKRLPTLPNSPSSAYEASLQPSSPPKSVDEDYLQSHFSAITISTATQRSSSLEGTVSSLFDFTEDHQTTLPSRTSCQSDHGEAPTLLGEALTVNHGLMTSPHLPSMPQTPTMENRGLQEETQALPCESSSSTLSSDDGDQIRPDSVLPGLGIESNGFSGIAQKRQGHPLAPPHLFQYRLPLIEEVSAEGKHNNMASPIGSARTPTYSPLAIRRQDSLSDPARPGVPHSTSMQQLMDELSYLGDMINT